MMRSKPIAGRHLGWSDTDRATKPYARFLDPDIQALPDDTRHALDRGPLPEPLLPALDAAAPSLFGQAAAIENGFALAADGATMVAARTDLPIRFVEPASLGFADPTLDDPEQATIVCARTGLGDLPIDVGYLAHHVRRTDGGSEMRSRFWIGGPYAAGRNSALGTVIAQAARLFMRPSEADARALLVHCAEEMRHLARFLPALYAEFRLQD
jgi:DAPG hydrolase PhiG domain